MSTHCCEMMRSNVEFLCGDHADRHDCPDCLIHYSSKTQNYGIMIHDGGTSSVGISFCPWCGKELLDGLKS